MFLTRRPRPQDEQARPSARRPRPLPEETCLTGRP
ncbi:hypothetical protein FHS40_008134 [Streptomyces spectabilis]|uniref:Uncharacterized protein n=1 Tax=Streptomyces spectabilis TaxID=68270 RepID=A0A7W8B2A4_STRST|nr:hypothetical protein [Streptomyces spectabilis]